MKPVGQRPKTYLTHSADGAPLSMSALEAEDDEAVIEIEPPAPKRKNMATLQV